MSLSVKDIEPNWFDALTTTPYVASHSLTHTAKAKFRASKWHGLWIIPLSIGLNGAASALLAVACLINMMIGLIMWPITKSLHQLTTARDQLFCMGICFVRVFWVKFDPIAVSKNMLGTSA